MVPPAAEQKCIRLRVFGFVLVKKRDTPDSVGADPSITLVTIVKKYPEIAWTKMSDPYASIRDTY